jgi:hypothetical protein
LRVGLIAQRSRDRNLAPLVSGEAVGVRSMWALASLLDS